MTEREALSSLNYIRELTVPTVGTFRGFGTERARLGSFRGFGTERARLGTCNQNFEKFTQKIERGLWRKE